MAGETIEGLLQKRGAWLKGRGGSRETATARSTATQLISRHYETFERLRDAVLNGGPDAIEQINSRSGISELLHVLNSHDLITPVEAGLKASDHGRRFLSGGWLEELAFLAALDAGADEALYGQSVGWSVQGYEGENEIDLIVRRGGTLGFVSCKALKSMINIEDRKHRNRLMDAIHEADNLADHFGRPGERVAVLVTTDLFDEMKGSPRYKALMGKAAVLDVRIIALEELGWDKLVQAINGLMAPDAAKGDMA